ncbi:MAG TPA: hypothetical protein VIL40_02380 [Thermaerobacter sp.]
MERGEAMAGLVAAGMAAGPARPQHPDSPTAWAALLGALLCAVAIGYAVGRRQGRREGYRLGRAEAPLVLRAEALVRGACPVCDHGAAAAAGRGDRPREGGVGTAARFPGGRAAPDPAGPRTKPQSDPPLP